MRYSDIIEFVAVKNRVGKSVVTRIINSYWKAIEEALKKDGEVVIPRKLKIEVKEAKTRRARNPQTGEEIIIPERKVIKFKKLSELKKIEKEINGEGEND